MLTILLVVARFSQRVMDETDPEIKGNPEQVTVSPTSSCHALDKLVRPHETTLSLLFLHCPSQRLVFCSGQIYYELLAEREKRGVTDIALVRMEQIAPFPFDRIAKNAQRYSNAEIIWAQQEPK